MVLALLQQQQQANAVERASNNVVARAENRAAFITLLRKCADSRDLSAGKLVHARMAAIGADGDTFLSNFLVQMYGKCGRVDEARGVFNKMPHRNVFSWTLMIAAYQENGYSSQALQLFRQMDLEGVEPDSVALVGVLSAFPTISAGLVEGKTIHARIVANGFDSDVIVATALVNMYGKCGRLDEARNVFEKMQSRNVVSWNAMITAYAQAGHYRCVFQLHRMMDLEGLRPTDVTFICILDACEDLEQGRAVHARIVASGFMSEASLGNSLVDMYGKFGSLEDARSVFDGIPCKTVISWTAMIAAYVQHGRGENALEIYRSMDLHGVKPNQVTLINILGACSGTEALAEGRAIHARIVANGFEENVVVGNCLIDMYGKCGSVDDAGNVFEGMKRRSVVSWNAVIAANAQQGHFEKVLELYHEMNLAGMQPDGITITIVLNACSHAGLVNEGRQYFVCLSQDYGITPEEWHYGCMIDILGRAGWLNEAEDLIHSMPFQPTVVAWKSLIAACKVHSSVKRGTRAAQRAFELEPASASYVMLSNIVGNQVDMLHKMPILVVCR